eukprot:gene6702-7795_t
MLKSIILLTLAVVAISAINTKQQSNVDGINFQVYSIVAGSTDFVVSTGNQTNAIAWATFSNAMMTTGWGYLSIGTSGNFPDSVQAEAAGFLEGYVTHDMIYSNWFNMYVNEYKKTISPAAIAWIQANNQYMTDQVQANPSDPYWQQVGLVFAQVSALAAGYAAANTDPAQSLEFNDILLMNMDGDMIDLGPALNISFADSRPPAEQLGEFMRKTGHCSGLVKLTDDLSDLYTGHTTWSSFYEMVRLFKVYTFAFSSAAGSVSATTMFSSYPASLSSIDDFYLLDTGLVVTETTNGLMNNNLYYIIMPQSILSWIRVIIANRMASNGLQWCNIFSLQNSGTYNNQWIVVDYNKFEANVAARDGLVYVLEQLPGYIEFDDVTPIVRAGYWPSYNVPFFENVYNMSGFNETSQYGTWFSYELAPRATIFRRDANSISSFTEFQAEMRYNNWEHDPLALGNSGNQVSSRFDLVTKPSPNNPYLNKDAFGGIDSKAVSANLVAKMQVAAQSGPTHDQQPPFSWKAGTWTYTHVGMPDFWDFAWMTMNINNMTPQ